MLAAERGELHGVINADPGCHQVVRADGQEHGVFQALERGTVGIDDGRVGRCIEGADAEEGDLIQFVYEADRKCCLVFPDGKGRVECNCVWSFDGPRTLCACNSRVISWVVLKPPQWNRIRNYGRPREEVSNIEKDIRLSDGAADVPRNNEAIGDFIQNEIIGDGCEEPAQERIEVVADKPNTVNAFKEGG